MQVSIKDANAKTSNSTTHERSSMDNPLAFPTYDHHANGQQFLAEVGMTLRDYFAARAMQSYLLDKDRDSFTFEQWANAAYDMADAMLKARDL